MGNGSISALIEWFTNILTIGVDVSEVEKALIQAFSKITHGTQRHS